MDEDQDKLAERLEAISGQVGKIERKSRTIKYLVGGVVGVGLAAGALSIGVVLGGRDESEPVLDTASAPEFPADEGLAPVDMLPVPVRAATVAPQTVVVDNTENEELLRDLRNRIDELQRAQENAEQTGQAAQEEALQAVRERMQADLDAVKDIMESAQSELAASERAREADAQRYALELEQLRLSHDLEMRRLEAETARAGSVPGMSEDDLRTQEREAAERARLEELRKRQEELRQARIDSPLLALSGGGAVAEGADAVERTLSQGEAFVKGALARTQVAQASRIARPDVTIVQGTLIQAALETAIDSTLPGALRAVVAEDVHSFDGSNVLIPRGSKLFGEYDADINVNQSRILVAWTRIVTPSGRSVSISSYGTDDLGRSGTTGQVDNHFFAKFGAAALISIIGAVPTLAAASTDDAVTQETAEDVGEDIHAATQNAMNEYLSLKPTIYVPQGSEIAVMLDRDIALP